MIVAWFSAGAASAVATKLALSAYPEVEIVRILVAEEDADNDRFARDCAAWFGQPICEISSREYASCDDVWRRRRFMSGPKGAPCTGEMKKAVRFDYEREAQPSAQVFGFTVEERHRAERMRREEPAMGLLTPLIDAGMTKADCFKELHRAGIALPRVYGLGFPNANCIGCVKATSPAYWNRVRQHFPEVFFARAALSREIGARLVRVKGERRFLDELPADDQSGLDLSWDCGIACAAPEREVAV